VEEPSTLSDSDVIAALIVVRSCPRNREFGRQGPKVPCAEMAPLSSIFTRKVRLGGGEFRGRQLPLAAGPTFSGDYVRPHR
jgi:hypothetical protein